LSPIVASEGDYFAKIALLLQSDQLAPDVVTEDTFQLATDVEAGYLTVLDPYLAKDADWPAGAYYASLIEGVRGLDGKVYGIPYFHRHPGLWYNRNLFRQVGLPDPWQPKPGRTSSTPVFAFTASCPMWVAVLVQFRCRDRRGDHHADLSDAAARHGGTVRDEESGNGLCPARASWIRDLSGNDLPERFGAAAAQGCSIGQASYIAAREYLPQGKLVISMDGNWIAGNYLETGASPWPEHSEVLGFTAMPTQYGQEPYGVSTVGGWGWSIPAKSDNKDLAMSFIQVLMSPPLYTDAIIARGGLGSREDLVLEEAYTALPFVETAASFLPFGTFRPKDKRYPEISAHTSPSNRWSPAPARPMPWQPTRWMWHGPSAMIR
jgi:multiple sugar transport system substrate-binding protein